MRALRPAAARIAPQGTDGASQSQWRQAMGAPAPCSCAAPCQRGARGTSSAVCTCTEAMRSEDYLGQACLGLSGLVLIGAAAGNATATSMSTLACACSPPRAACGGVGERGVGQTMESCTGYEIRAGYELCTGYALRAGNPSPISIVGGPCGSDLIDKLASNQYFSAALAVESSMVGLGGWPGLRALCGLRAPHGLPQINQYFSAALAAEPSMRRAAGSLWRRRYTNYEHCRAGSNARHLASAEARGVSLA